MDMPLETSDSFRLGTPALVCRWRLSNRKLPLENRHLRSLSWRRLDERPLSAGLISWAKQHIEWTLADGAVAHPDGVLMLVVDDAGQAAMTVGPYEELHATKLAHLVGRARTARVEALDTGVAPESLWVWHDECLYWGIDEDAHASGAASLIEDLARTLGTPVERSAHLLDDAHAGELDADEAFLVSDEHGVVLACDDAGEEGHRLRDAYRTLLARTH